MTEENKENCNFQQNYNVFGLDDKPCCYLYHKYCDEIDSCYFKRCKRLEQENEKLSFAIEKCLENAGIECDDEEQALRSLPDLGASHYKILQENKPYRSALEEISGLASPHCTQCSQIIKIVNEVLKWYTTHH